LVAHSREVCFAAGETLTDIGRPVEHVLFPLSGMISLVVALREGSTVESAVIGNDGVLGVEFALGGGRSASWAIGQVSGEALSIAAQVLREHQASWPSLQGLAAPYAASLMRQMAQSAACNRYHPVEQRFAKWLLLTRDRVGDRFAITQEFLADMLGTYRPTVTIAARTLSRAGLVSYGRGVMTVLDRDGLEAAACECYAALREE
jgi:CRP-like cAMP-binding protein